MRVVIAILGLLVVSASLASGQGKSRTLVAVWAHPDDEGPVAPVLARYAREGVQVHLIIATDGSQGVANTTAARGPDVAKLRAEEARCAAQALGINPPVLLGFPDGGLGNNVADPSTLSRLTEQLVKELHRLRPDAVITWGPDGGYGHPDHRLVSSIVTQLARAEVPGMPQRVFYSTIPVEGIRALNPKRGEPPYLIPQARLLNVSVGFTDADFEAARRSLACHRTQFSDETIDRLVTAMRAAWKGQIPLSPMVPQPPSTDLFK
jgi:LmbE family N-acetylglucosaminyl deacetylase